MAAKTPVNYILSFIFFTMSAIYSVIGKGYTWESEFHVLSNVAMALILAWSLQKDKPLQVELTVKKGE